MLDYQQLKVLNSWKYLNDRNVVYTQEYPITLPRLDKAHMSLLNACRPPIVVLYCVLWISNRVWLIVQFSSPCNKCKGVRPKFLTIQRRMQGCPSKVLDYRKWVMGVCVDRRQRMGLEVCMSNWNFYLFRWRISRILELAQLVQTDGMLFEESLCYHCNKFI